MQVERDMTGTLRKETHGHEPVIAFTQNQAGDVLTGEVMHNLGTNSNATGRNAANVMAFNEVGSTVKGGSGERGYPDPSDGNGHNIVGSQMQVRRLTPRECERLQGFPDDHTAIIYNGKPAADGSRYKALGNSMAVNCMSWIGQRIQMCDEVLKELKQ